VVNRQIFLLRRRCVAASGAVQRFRAVLLAQRADTSTQPT
jgi:hypothetical protein